MGLLNVQEGGKPGCFHLLRPATAFFFLALERAESRQAFVATRQGDRTDRCYNGPRRFHANENPSRSAPLRAVLGQFAGRPRQQGDERGFCDAARKVKRGAD